MNARISARYATWYSISLAIALLLAQGCAGQRQRVAYSNFGEWNDTVASLGPVEACQGGFCCPEGQCQWPLSLTNPPPVETYHRALIEDALKRYGVPSDEVVLDQVTVELITEIVGTVRGWSAEAVAGQKDVAANAAAIVPVPEAATVEQRLEQLEALHTKGLLSDDEFTEKRGAILDGL